MILRSLQMLQKDELVFVVEKKSRFVMASRKYVINGIRYVDSRLSWHVGLQE